MTNDFVVICLLCLSVKGDLHWVSGDVRLRNNLKCVEWDVKPYYTPPSMYVHSTVNALEVIEVIHGQDEMQDTENRAVFFMPAELPHCMQTNQWTLALEIQSSR